MKNYRGIRSLIRTFRILGWISFILTMLASCGAFIFMMSATDNIILVGILGSFGLFAGPAIFVSGMAFSASLFFAAGVLELLLDISQFSFETRDLMRRALTRAAEPAASVK